MKNNKSYIGVWLDHAEARFVEAGKSAADITTIHSENNGRVRFAGEAGDGTRLGKNHSTDNESHKHNKEQNEDHHFYSALSEHLKPYDNIFLFGPTSAKDELHNFLKKDKHFAEKNISAEAADKMSDNQLAARVRDFFSTAAK